MANTNLLPKYEVVRREMRSRILSGQFMTGRKLPSERDLVEEFGVSRITVIRAMKSLEQEGMISRGVGRGSFVQDRSKLAEVAVVLSANLMEPGTSPYFRMAATALVRAIRDAEWGWRGRMHLTTNPLGIENVGQDLDLLDSEVLPQLRGVFTFCPLPGIAERLHENGVPLVYLGIDAFFTWRYQIFFDYPDLYRRALGYLRSHGAQTIGTLVEAHRSNLDQPVGRFSWFSSAANASGLVYRPDWTLYAVNDTGATEQGGYELFKRFWQQSEKPDALFVDDEITCRGVLRAALELGVRFPQDIRLITAISRGTELPYHQKVTRFEFVPATQVKEAIDLMSQLFANPALPEARRFLPGDLVIGETA